MTKEGRSFGNEVVTMASGIDLIALRKSSISFFLQSVPGRDVIVAVYFRAHRAL